MRSSISILGAGIPFDLGSHCSGFEIKAFHAVGLLSGKMGSYLPLPGLLLGAPGRTTRNKKLIGAPGRTTRSKDATRGSWPYY